TATPASTLHIGLSLRGWFRTSECAWSWHTTCHPTPGRAPSSPGTLRSNALLGRRIYQVFGMAALPRPRVTWCFRDRPTVYSQLATREAAMWCGHSMRRLASSERRSPIVSRVSNTYQCLPAMAHLALRWDL